jgi:hypothetical protein
VVDSTIITINVAQGSSAPWSSLRGAAYPWQGLLRNPDAQSDDPSVGFPLMKGLGYTLARGDVVDWSYIEANPATYLANLQYYADYADANGIGVIYLFGGGNVYVIPPDLVLLFGSASAFYSAWWADQTTSYKGITAPLWEIAFQRLWTPFIQAVDSHPSTQGYGMWNEPGGANDTILHNYYQYTTQRIRTLSRKPTGFQCTTNGGGTSAQIQTQAPTRDLLPYYFEGHMYTWSGAGGAESIELANWGAAVNALGCYGLLGETHNLQLDFWQQVHSQGFAGDWYSWRCRGGTDLLDASCNPDSYATQLAAVYGQVWG